MKKKIKDLGCDSFDKCEDCPFHEETELCMCRISHRLSFGDIKEALDNKDLEQEMEVEDDA